MDKWSRDYADSLHPVQEVLRQAKERSKELLKVQAAKVSPQTADLEELPIVDDWSTAQSTIGIMTPTEDWSDLGSDTTEIGHTPPITRHSLQLCQYVTADFLRLISEIVSLYNKRYNMPVSITHLEPLHKAFDELIVHLLHALNAPVPSHSHLSQVPRVESLTNRALEVCIGETQRFLCTSRTIEESFGHLSGSTPVRTEDIEAMHTAYSRLVGKLLFYLAAPIPFQDGRFTSTPAQTPAPAQAPVPAAPASVPVPVPEVPGPVIPEVQSDICIDKALEAIINSMEPTPTEKDIMKLIFHWTTLEECNGFKRAEVMQFD